MIESLMDTNLDITDDIYWIKPNLGIMPHPVGGKALPYELKTLKKAGVDTLVSLLSRSEAKQIGLKKEGRIAKKASLKFVHFPLDDGNAPPQEPAGLQLIEDLARDYKSNKKVVIHCFAGIGRSGTVAVAILFAAGEEPVASLRLARQKRGKPIPETQEQMEWLKWVHFQKKK